MKFFDCDAAYGRGATALPHEVLTADDLRTEMDHFGISDALVWHRDAWGRHYEAGNQRIMNMQTYPGLHPVMSFIPPVCDEMPSAEDFIRAMRAREVRVLRVMPGRHRFCLDPVSCGLLLELCVAYSVPVILPFTEVGRDWDRVYQLMRNFPRLRLILTCTGSWSEDRYFRPLMKAHNSFRITTNRLETAGQLAGITNAVGSGQVLFGSGLPWHSPGGAIMGIARADIADDDKEAIAHGNVERLLKEVAW